MRRALLCCAIALAGAVAGAPAVRAADPPLPPRASLQGYVCERAPEALNRVIAVTAVMRPLTGTQRMKMRFELQRRTGGVPSFGTVHGGDLGRWMQPTPVTLGQRSTDVWKLKKLVANLPGPAAYRFRITFQWLDATGAALDRTTLLSPLCQEP